MAKKDLSNPNSLFFKIVSILSLGLILLLGISASILQKDLWLLVKFSPVIILSAIPLVALFYVKNVSFDNIAVCIKDVFSNKEIDVKDIKNVYQSFLSNLYRIEYVDKEGRTRYADIMLKEKPFLRLYPNENLPDNFIEFLKILENGR